MNLIKKVVHLSGVALLPVKVGSRAVLASGGQVTCTSRVVAVHTQTEEELCFETLNTNYRVSMSPSPRADCAMLPMRMAA